VQIIRAPVWGLFVLLCSVRKCIILILIFVYSGTLLGPALWQNCKPLIHFISCMRRNLRSEEQFVLVVSKNTYAQLKHEENEMWWDGYLVDINSINIKNDVVELVVEKDHYETKCLNQYNQLGKHKFPKEPTALWQWLNKVYLHDDSNACVNAVASIAIIPPAKNYPLSIAFLHVDCPPPDAA
jgi:hypothetical protein